MEPRLEDRVRSAGYVLTEPLGESGPAALWRARRSVAPGTVLLKLPRDAETSPQTLAAYHREFELLRGLEGQGVANALALDVRDRSPILVFEDPGAERSLQTVIEQSGPMALERFHPLALALADAVGKLHELGVVHNSVCASNVLVDTALRRVRLIGLDQATRLPEERHGLRADSALARHTLASMSPEQTGRVNRSVDYRTDLYSLGVLLYQLLSGTLPFRARDASGCIYAHVAIIPAPLTEVRPEVPSALARIVAKLLEKAPERRYQNAYGLHHDLLAARAQAGPFELGAGDRSGRFLLSECLYGRETESLALLDAFTLVANGACHMVLFSGYSGIGKSALVRELHLPMLERGARFFSGKFDQLEQGLPYSAFKAAFRELVLQLTEEPKGSRDAWAERFRQKLGANLSVVTDVIPELQILVGEQPRAAVLDAHDAQDRFQLAFRQLVGCLAREDHPLVLFLDDLQWIDLASLELLERLHSAVELSHLLLIGAYRSNEVPPGHPLHAAVSRISKDHAVSTIELGPLSVEHLASLVSDSFAVSPSEAQPLAELLQARTGGNPFFVRQFLRLLYLDELLRFEFQQGRWKWDAERSSRLGATENVVDLMVHHLHRLSEPAQAALARAACLGSRFDLRSLALVEGCDPHQVHELLWPALQAGLLQPEARGRDWRELGSEGAALLDEHAAEIVYAFLHDRVQQAAYSLIPDEELAPFQLRVGRLLRAELSQSELEQRIFEVVGHFRPALDLLQSEDERVAVARLFALAAERARTSTAFATAISAAETGLQLIHPDPFALDYALALGLQRLLGECQGQQGNFDAAERALLYGAERCRSSLDRVDLLTFMMEVYVSNGRVPQALATLIRILGEFEIPLDAHTVEQVAAHAAETVAKARRGRSVEEIVASPEAHDPQALALLRALGCSIDTAYMSGHAWVVAVTSIAVRTALEKGVTASASMVFSTYGLIAAEPETAEGYALRHEYGVIGAKVADRFGDLAWISRSHVSNPHLFGTPFQGAVALIQRGVVTGWASGAFTWGAYAETERLGMRLVAGDPLGALEKDLRSRRPRVDEAKRVIIICSLDLLERFLDSLAGKVSDRLALGPSEAEAAELETSAMGMGPYVAAKWFTFKLFLAALYGDHAGAEALRQAAAGQVHGLIGISTEYLFRLASALTLAGLKSQVADPEELEGLALHFHEHAQVNPDYEPAAHLVRGLCTEAAGSWHPTVEHYNRALETAREHGQRHIEAIAAERAGELALRMGRDSLAAFYLLEAEVAYRDWGAGGKVEDLRARHTEILRPPSLDAEGQARATSASLQLGDAESLLKACLAISGELRLDELIRRQLEMLLENAGAQRGLILLERDGQLVEIAESRLTADGIQTARVDIEMNASTRLIAERVWRSGEAIVLDEAWDEQRFLLASLPEAERPHSVLCMPILPEPAAVLYLDTHAAPRWFTIARRDTLSFLSTQATTSLQNAFLFRDLQLEIEERRRVERELRVERDFWTGVIQLIPLAVCHITPDGTTTFVNRAVERITGYSAEELVGKNWWSVLYPGAHYRQVEELCYLLEEEEQVSGHEMNLVDRAGLERQVSWTLVILYDEQGEQTKIVGFGEDVTDRRRMESEAADLEAQLRQRQKLETVGTMAGGVAHDFNNILTPILGLGELLEEQLQGDPEASSQLQSIIQSAERAKSLVRQLLTFSARRLEVESRSTRLQDIVAEVTALMRASLPATIEFTQDLDPSCPPAIADPDQLHQVLLNLCTNAAHAMDGAGTLGLRLAQVDDRIRLQVSDTGNGMDAATQERVFEPFFTTKPIEMGTGLGLSVVHGIVRAHGGSITLESQLGLGTTFTVELPTSVEEEPQAPSSVKAELSSAEGRIMVVDDEAPIVRFVQACLSRQGYEVVGFSNGREALEAFHNSPGAWEAVVTDYTMPKLSGLALASELHALRPDLPIVLMTGRNPGLSDTELEQAGVVAILEKPFRVEKLVMMVGRVALPRSERH